MAFVPYVPTTRSKSPTTSPRLWLLYVEDEDANWELTENELCNDFNVVRAKDSREAFEQVAKRTFHMILMDIQLSRSDLDGIQITQIWRKLYTKVVPSYALDVRIVDEPIVFVTAYSSRYSREELMSYGADEVTTKPVRFNSLKLLLSTLLLRSARK